MTDLGEASSFSPTGQDFGPALRSCSRKACLAQARINGPESQTSSSKGVCVCFGGWGGKTFHHRGSLKQSQDPELENELVQ